MLRTVRKSNGLSPGYRLLRCMEAAANFAPILNMLSSSSVCQLDGGDIRAVSVAGLSKDGPSSSQVSAVLWSAVVWGVGPVQ